MRTQIPGICSEILLGHHCTSRSRRRPSPSPRAPDFLSKWSTQKTLESMSSQSSLVSLLLLPGRRRRREHHRPRFPSLPKSSSSSSASSLPRLPARCSRRRRMISTSSSSPMMMMMMMRFWINSSPSTSTSSSTRRVPTNDFCVGWSKPKSRFFGEHQQYPRRLGYFLSMILRRSASTRTRPFLLCFSLSSGVRCARDCVCVPIDDTKSRSRISFSVIP